MNNWKKQKLSDFMQFNPSTALAKGTLAKKVSMENLVPFNKKIQGYEKAFFLGGTKFHNDDTLIARITPCLENGKISYVDILEDNEVAFGSTEFIVLREKPIISDSNFIFYLAISEHFRKTAIQLMTGTSGRQRVETNALKEKIFFLPPLPTQRAIAATLSCLDEKIELNRRINTNLEAQAQALFKSWFVDFEPFKDGEFVDSELGRIPKGWRVGLFSDLGAIIGGATPSKKQSEYFTMPGKGISWITPKDLSVNKDKFISFGEIDITEEGYKNCSTNLMPKGTVLFSSRAPIGYLAIANKELCTNQGFKSVIPNNDIGTAYVYYYLKTNLDTIESHASGSTFKEISGSVLKNIAVIIPDKDILSEFNDICNQIFKLQERNEAESRTLAAIRDTLLPKLMSGEIEVEK
jgi:type I restriction enzyme S subunit